MLPLAGVKVFDMGHEAVGPWAGMILGALGAKVIKVESPSGDKIIHQAPLQGPRSPAYAHCNLNKYNMVLDLKSADGRRIAHRMILETDVLIENMRPGTTDRLGMNYHQLSELNPRLIYASASAWGWSGPMLQTAGVDMTVQAFGGSASSTGYRGESGQLNRFYGSIDTLTSWYLAAGIVEALNRRDATARGSLVRVSQLGAALAWQALDVAHYWATDVVPKPLGSASRFTAPHEAFRCQDGKYLAIGVENHQHWVGLCRALGVQQLSEDPLFATNERRVENQLMLASHLQVVIGTRPFRWWEIRLTDEEVPHGPFLDFDSLQNHLQVHANRYIDSVEIPDMGPLFVGGFPVSYDGNPLDLAPSYAPGTHTELAVGGYDRLGDRASAARRVARRGPVRVLDLSQGISGPYASLLLAQSGCEVVKLEPADGDYSRHFHPGAERGSAIHAALNRGKTIRLIDWATSSGKAEVRRLIGDSDVVIADLDSPIADLRSDNSSLVICRISGFGPQGPWRTRPCSELVAQATAGYWNSLGRLGDSPIRLGPDLAGMATGLMAYVGVSAALNVRTRKRQAVSVEVSQFGALLHLRGIQWSYYTHPADWFGFSCDGSTKPEDFGYRTRDGRIYFTCTRSNKADFHAILAELGLEDAILDPRFQNTPEETVEQGRYAHELKSIWERGLIVRSTREVQSIFARHGGEAVPIMDLATVVRDPQVSHLGALERDNENAASWFVGRPWRSSEPDVRETRRDAVDT